MRSAALAGQPCLLPSCPPVPPPLHPTQPVSGDPLYFWRSAGEVLQVGARGGRPVKQMVCQQPCGKSPLPSTPAGQQADAAFACPALFAVPRVLPPGVLTLHSAANLRFHVFPNLQANPEKAREPLLYRMSRLGLTPDRGLDLGGPGVQPHAEAALKAAAPIAAQFMEAA